LLASTGEYVNFVTIGVWDEAYGFVMALVVFLSTLKFINMLKFNRRMGMLTDTIKHTCRTCSRLISTPLLGMLTDTIKHTCRTCSRLISTPE